MANDGKPPEAIRTLREMAGYLPPETPVRDFARSVDELTREGVTPSRSNPVIQGHFLNPSKAIGKYL